MNKLAPIVLFVYNRPRHTELTLQALAINNLARESILYIFADGPKYEANTETLKNIASTRAVIKSKKWCKEVVIIERENNLGLANSIITGVTEIINRHSKIIVLEDDILPSTGFLTYMNEALNLYQDEESVGCIHAWNYHLDTAAYNESTFFLKGADCWGWATWKRAWKLFNLNGESLLETIRAQKLEYEFDRKGTHSYVQMLGDQIENKNDSWAIRWHASLFLAEKYCLQPSTPIVKNIGLDGTGIHSGFSEMPQQPIQNISLQKIKIKEEDWFFNAYRAMEENLVKKADANTWQKSKVFLKNLYHRF